MPEGAREHDCLILGAGPAGAFLACILARWGRRVVLLEVGGAAHGPPEEPASARTLALLARHDLARLASAGSGGATVREGQPPAAGARVVRASFDRELRRAAAGAGARLLAGSWAGAPQNGNPLDFRTTDGVEVPLRAPVVVAATDAAAALLPHRVAAESAATVALSALTAPGRARRLSEVLEAVPEGWIRWLPLSTGEVHVRLHADRDEARERGHDALWRSALEHAEGPARGCLAASARAVDATPRLRTSRCEVLLAGPAASRFDDLTERNLDKDLASAEAAAHAVSALLADPQRAGELRASHAAWERGLFVAHTARARHFHAREARFAGQPFWSRRRGPTPPPAQPSSAAARKPR